MTASQTDHRTNRSRHRPRRAAALAAGLLLASGCTAGGTDGPTWSAGELRLVSFDSCDNATEQLRDAVLDQVGPWGLTGGGRGIAVDDLSAADAAEEAPLAGAPAAPADGAGAPAQDLSNRTGERAAAPDSADHSGTNVHEAGVDEPDLVKTDGDRIVTVTGGVLRVVDADRRTETGSLSLLDHGDGVTSPGWQPADLLLHGDHALVLLNQGWHVPEPVPLPEPVPDPAGTDGPAAKRPAASSAPDGSAPEPLPIAGPQLLLVDLTGAPRVVSDYTVDGALVDARAVGGVARVVVRSGPRLELPSPDPDATEREQLAANREAVASADVTDWLPRYRVAGAGATATGQVDCTSVSHPAEYSGTSMLTVLTFDLGRSALGDGSPVSVVADGDTVYSNGTSLYVASDQRWRAPAGWDGRSVPDQRTEIYKFDLSEPGPPRYAAAGAVEGWLLNQYAMSEWDGHLRVATTISGDERGTEDGEPDTSSTVYVLAEKDGALVEVGSAAGLGKGERIYSVRYAGAVGYVVTFRETDPLYTLDLRDPTAPTVRGELKVTGYSAYLHDLGDGHLLGVGQEADQQGVVQGTQVSLFDVSDLTDPQLQDKHHVQFGHSEAEFDPHAFLWWPAEQLVVIPLTTAGGGTSSRTELRDEQPPRYGALALRLVDGELVEQALVEHPGGDNWSDSNQIRRSLVIDDVLWTVSAGGLQANDLSTLDTLAWLPFR